MSAATSRDMVEEVLVALGLEELLRDVDEGLREEEGTPRAVAFLEDLEELPDEPLRLFLVLAVCLAGEDPARSDGRHVDEVLRDLPVEVDVGEDRLPAPGHRLLGELEDEHLGELLHLVVAHPLKVGRKEDVDGVPADGPGEIALQGRGKFHQVGEEHLRVLRRLCHGERMGEIEAEFLDVFEGLAAAVRPVYEAEIVEVDIAVHMRVGDVLGKNGEEGELLLYPFGQGEVRRLRPVGHVRVLLVRMEDQVVHVVDRHTEPGMHPPGRLQPLLDQLRVDELPDQRGRHHLDARLHDQLLHAPADGRGRIPVDHRLPHQGVDYP